MAYDITEPEDWESICAISGDGFGESLLGIGGGFADFRTFWRL